MPAFFGKLREATGLSASLDLHEILRNGFGIDSEKTEINMIN